MLIVGCCLSLVVVCCLLFVVVCCLLFCAFVVCVLLVYIVNGFVLLRGCSLFFGVRCSLLLDAV